MKANFWKNIDWNIFLKKCLIILRTFLLLVFESMILIIFIQGLQLKDFDQAMIWLIQHKRLFGVSSLSLVACGYFLYAIIGRFWLSNSLNIIIWSAFGFANQQKMMSRGAPLLPADLTFIKQPGEIVGMADKSSLTKLLSVLLFFS